MNEIKMILLDFQLYIVKHTLTTLKKFFIQNVLLFLKQLKRGKRFQQSEVWAFLSCTQVRFI